MKNPCILFLRNVATPALILLLSFAPAFAQLEQGRWMVGGGLGGANIAINEQQPLWNGQNFTPRYFSQAGINIGTNLGYFVTNNLVVGGNFGTGVSASSSDSFFRNASVNWNIGAGPFIRYYAIPLSSAAALFGGAYLGYSVSLSSFPPYTQPFVLQQLNPNLNIGGTWFITKNVAVEGYVAYERRFVFFNERPQIVAFGGTIIDRGTIPAFTQNNGALTFGVNFQIFLDKLF